MEDRMRRNMTSSDIWSRALFMVLFAIAFSVAKMIIVLLVIFQFFAVLVTGRVNEPVLRLAKNMNAYLLEVLEFQTFNTERHPFPFSPWPDEEPGGEVWLYDDDLDDDDYEEEAEVVVKPVKKTRPARKAKSEKAVKPAPDGDQGEQSGEVDKDKDDE